MTDEPVAEADHKGGLDPFGSGLTWDGMLKRSPEDFAVAEAVLPPRPDPEGAYALVDLTKSGLTTFMALRQIALLAGIEVGDVDYAGLKDEDAVTTQCLTIPWHATKAFPLATSGDQWIRAAVRYRTSERLAVSQVAGNAFAVTVRDISPDVGQRLDSSSGPFTFVNYYDTQRFGLAGQRKRSHLAGRALAATEYATALMHLREGGIPGAVAHTGSVAQFFAELDQREIAFYLSSYESWRWNAELGRRIAQLASEAPGYEVANLSRQGLPFGFAPPLVRLRLLKRAPYLPLVRHRLRDGTVRAIEGQRSTVVQAQVHISVDDDCTGAGDCRAGLRFFLPSGCYATMLVGQLLLDAGWRPDRQGEGESGTEVVR